jgi:hypothetical protein
MDIPEAAHRLARELAEIFGDRLKSLSAYGLHAPHVAPSSHRHPDEPRDIHTLAILDTITASDLDACARRVAAWQAAGLDTPLLLAEREFERALDVFPLEFGAILADHIVVSGRSPFQAMTVHDADIRRGCEVQARSHLLHLREGVLETRGRADALAVLIVESAAPFAALLQSLARLDGIDARDPGAVGRHAERRLNLPGGAVTSIVALAGVDEISSDEALRLFPAYLDAVEKLVAYVDGWGSR